VPTVYRVTVDQTVYAKLARQWDYLAQHAGAVVADRYVARVVDSWLGHLS
jgi:hypothetical protein